MWRRQRHMADSVENVQHAARVVELNFKQRVVARNHGRFNAFIVAEQQRRARFRRFRRANVPRIRLSSSMRSTSTSILPPLALRPNRRAGITRVLLKPADRQG